MNDITDEESDTNTLRNLYIQLVKMDDMITQFYLDGLHYYIPSLEQQKEKIERAIKVLVNKRVDQ